MTINVLFQFQFDFCRQCQRASNQQQINQMQPLRWIKEMQIDQRTPIKPAWFASKLSTSSRLVNVIILFVTNVQQVISNSNISCVVH